MYDGEEKRERPRKTDGEVRAVARPCARARVHRSCVCSGAVCRAHSRDLQLMKLGCSRVACQINMSPAPTPPSFARPPPASTGNPPVPPPPPPLRQRSPLRSSRLFSPPFFPDLFLILLSIRALSRFQHFNPFSYPNLPASCLQTARTRASTRVRLVPRRMV